MTYLSRTVFLDRDGTLMREVDYCRDPDMVEISPGVPEGLQRLHAAGFRLVIITNQSGLGRGRISLAEYHAVHARLLALLPAGLIEATYFCADHPDMATHRRKPAPGMLQEAAADLHLNLPTSFLIGDKASDIECARRAGALGILVQTGYGSAENPEGACFVAADFGSAVQFILAQS